MRLLNAILFLFLFASCSSWSGQPINSKASIVKETELDSIRSLFKIEKQACHPAITVLKVADPSKYDLTSFVDTNINILQLTLPTHNSTWKTTIAVSNSVGNYMYSGKTGDSILCDQSKEFLFMAWFDEPFYKENIVGDVNKNHRYEMHIRIIEKNRGRIILDEILYKTSCCINNLDIQYNPYTHSLLYAFNDFGGNEYKLLYGFIKLDKSLNALIQKPLSISFKDATEKRQPTFLDNGNGMLLYHSIGDNWQMLSGHTGKQQIGIFKIDTSNHLFEHKIVSDKIEIDDKIIMVKDTVFYRLMNSNEYDKMTIKKVAWKDLIEK